MKKAKKVVKHIHTEEVQVACKAIADGYMGGKVIKAGKDFQFRGNLKDGQFPRWCAPLEEFETAFERDEDSETVAPVGEPEAEAPEVKKTVKVLTKAQKAAATKAKNKAAKEAAAAKLAANLV